MVAEVVRKKDERAALPGYSCDVCRKFYGALACGGYQGLDQGYSKCSHVQAAGGKAGAAIDPLDDLTDTQVGG